MRAVDTSCSTDCSCQMILPRPVAETLLSLGAFYEPTFAQIATAIQRRSPISTILLTEYSSSGIVGPLCLGTSSTPTSSNSGGIVSAKRSRSQSMLQCDYSRY